MMIIDLPLDGGGAVRAGVIGSCRVYAPLGALARRGRARGRFLAGGMFSYTAAEAIQELAFARRGLAIPDRFAPLALNRARVGDLPARLAGLIDSCDVYLVEISTLDHFACGDFCFNYPSIATRVVRGAGPGAMAWFRRLSHTPSPPAIVAAALASMRAAGKVPDDATREILASLIRVRTEPQGLDAQVARIVDTRDRRWIFQPLFGLPERADGGDRARTALRGHVAGAGAAPRAEFFDVTPLIARAGQAAALDGGGVNVVHFAPAFLPTVGDALRDLLTGASAS
jgi:hypothetical protein